MCIGLLQGAGLQGLGRLGAHGWRTQVVLPGPWVPAGPVLWVLLSRCCHSWGCVHWLRGALQSPPVTLPPGGSGWQWGWGHQECVYLGQGLVAGGSAAWLWAPGRGRQGTFPPSALRLAPFPASGFSAGTEGGLLVQVLQCSQVPQATGNPGGGPQGLVLDPPVSTSQGSEQYRAGHGVLAHQDSGRVAS